MSVISDIGFGGGVDSTPPRTNRVKHIFALGSCDCEPHSVAGLDHHFHQYLVLLARHIFDLWLIFSLTVPFVEVLLHTYKVLLEAPKVHICYSVLGLP